MNLLKHISALRVFMIATVVLLMCACLFNSSTVAQQNGVVRGEIGKRLDEYFTSIAASGFSGVLLVVKNDQVLLSKGYGLANSRKHTPFTDKTVVDIGSITKQFTAAAILKLEMQGKLRTTDAIGKHIPGVPAEKSAITIHQLLTHSAGFENNFRQDDYAPLQRDEFIKLAMDAKLKFAPGTDFNYSNIGYSLLGAIIEIVTKQSYERYLFENLFTPAGITETGYQIPKWKRDEVAVGYYIYGFEWGSPLDKAWDTDGPYWNMRAATGMLSTVSDLYKWHLALGGEEVLSKAAKLRFFTPHIVAKHYGYGWVFTKTPRGTTLIWHDGSNKVFNAYFRRYVDEGVVAIIATNNASHQAEKEIGKLDELIFGKN